LNKFRTKNHIIMPFFCDIEQAQVLLQQGKVIAYPTEAVYGLGCCPFNKVAMERLAALKRRPLNKGFIVLIENWSQLRLLIGDVSEQQLIKVKKNWPGFVTRIFPKARSILACLSGEHPGIAIRMSAHPLQRALCQSGPLISTSANLSGQLPAIDVNGVVGQFPDGVDAILGGELGGERQVSTMFDVLTGMRIR
jgi:L-threonylcarbamoyladenylate synthase